MYDEMHTFRYVIVLKYIQCFNSLRFPVTVKLINASLIHIYRKKSLFTVCVLGIMDQKTRSTHSDSWGLYVYERSKVSSYTTREIRKLDVTYKISTAKGFWYLRMSS